MTSGDRAKRGQSFGLYSNRGRKSEVTKSGWYRYLRTSFDLLILKWPKSQNRTKNDEHLLHKPLRLPGHQNFRGAYEVKFVVFSPILTFLVILESGGQMESVDTHIDHIWWPRIFGLQYCEAKTSKAARSAAHGLSRPKIGMRPQEGHIQLWYHA